MSILKYMLCDDYVIWDGKCSSSYPDSRSVGQDCSIDNDGRAIPIDDLTEPFMEKGCYLIRFLACQAGFPAYEVHEEGQAYGVFTKCFDETQKTLPLRELITVINQNIAAYGLKQKSELVCPKKFLIMSLDEIVTRQNNREFDKRIFIQKLDMCRSFADKKWYDAFYSNRKNHTSPQGIHDIEWFLKDGVEPIVTPKGNNAIAYPKKLVEIINKKLEISVRVREHAPPHFHIKAPDVDACFAIEDCRYLKGNICPQKRKIVEYWFLYCKGREKLVEEWNKTRPGDCPVGEIII